jgi:hypothetical protein
MNLSIIIVAFNNNYLVGSLKFHTSSMFFRASVLKDTIFPSEILSGDKFISILVADKGKIKYAKKVMSVYRRNQKSISHNIDVKLLQSDLNIVKWIKNNIERFPINDYRSFLYKTFLLYPLNYSLIYFVRNYFCYVYFTLLASPRNIKYLFENKILNKVFRLKKIKRLF